MFLRCVVVDSNVLPAVAKVALVAEEADEPAIDKQTETLRRQVVVLVNFGQAVVEMVCGVVNEVTERQFHKLLVGEHLLHFAAHIMLNAIVVVDVQKAADAAQPRMMAIMREMINQA